MSIFQDRRTWLGAGSALAVLLVAMSWFLVISPMRSDTASLQSQQTAAEQNNAQLSQELVALKARKDDLASLRADLKAAVDGLPTDSGLPELTRQVSRQAVTSGVAVQSITVGAVTSAVPGATTPGATPAGRLFAIPVTITSAGTAKHQFAFLKALEQVGPRRVLVISTQIGPGPDSAAAAIDTSSTLTAVLRLFSAPLTPAGQAQLDRLIAGKGAN